MANHPRKGTSVSDEDYWDSSTASNIKTKGFNLFDDKVAVEETKNILRQQNIWDDTEDEEINDNINWDGTSAQSQPTNIVVGSKSVSYTPTQPGPASGQRSAKPDFPGVAAVGGQVKPQLPRQPATQVQPSASFKELSIDDVVGPQHTQSRASSKEVAKLEAEINHLKRALHSAKREKFSRIPPKETVRRMILGLPYSLEFYKSKEEKVSLLEEAIKSRDGNAITAAILFMKDTLKASIFNGELFKRRVAIDHYINYLRQHYEFNTLTELLSMLGRTDEAAMLWLNQACKVRNADTKLSALMKCYRAHFQTDQWLKFEAGLVNQQISLLERQMPVEVSDQMDEKKGAIIFKEHPRQASLVDTTTMTSLYYCCFYHYDLGENSLGSPKAIKKAHGLTDKQFVWIAAQARGRLRRWQDIKALFETKGWIGSVKMKEIVPFARLVHLLNNIKAPREVMNQYCSLITDTYKREEVARKYGLHECILELFMQQGNRQSIMEYQGGLKINSQEWFYASDILRNSSIKWKN